MICPQCGRNNKDIAKYCGFCGAILLEPDKEESEVKQVIVQDNYIKEQDTDKRQDDKVKKNAGDTSILKKRKTLIILSTIASIICLLFVCVLIIKSINNQIIKPISALSQEYILYDAETKKEICAFDLLDNLYYEKIKSVNNEIVEKKHIKKDEWETIKDDYALTFNQEAYKDYYIVKTKSEIIIDSAYKGDNFDASLSCDYNYLLGKKKEDNKWIIIGGRFCVSSLDEVEEEWQKNAVDLLNTLKSRDTQKIYSKSIVSDLIAYKALKEILNEDIDSAILKFIDDSEAYKSIDINSFIGTITESPEFIEIVKSDILNTVDELLREEVTIDDPVKDVVIDEIKDIVGEVTDVKTVVFLSNSREFNGTGFIMAKINDEWKLLLGYYGDGKIENALESL